MSGPPAADALIRILNLNRRLGSAAGPDADRDPSDSHSSQMGVENVPVWKVLVFDRLGGEVISSVLRKNDLRDNGITVHMNIQAERYPIADVPAVYLVEPTTDNVELIVKDMQKELYMAAYVNFSSSISRDLLETFATKAAEANVAEQMTQVYDQYVNFIVSEPEMFSLGMPNVFNIFNNPTLESQIEPTIDKIVTGLFSVVVTLGTLPLLRCPRGGPAEMVAQKLDSKLRDHSHNSRHLFRGANSFSQRPVMIILDRTVDMIPMFSHSWTYQALVEDALNLHRNRITVDADGKGKTYDLDSNDFFWAANSNNPFPQVAENIDRELNRYREAAADIVRKTGVDNIEDLNQEDMGNNASHLSWAMGLLPELSARKATIDEHFNILTTLLPIIKRRQLDNFFQMEESIMRQSKKQLLDAIRDPEKQDPEDKLRLFIIWYLSVENVSRVDMQQYEEALKDAGCDLKPLDFIKRVRELTRLTMMTSTTTAASTSTMGGGAGQAAQQSGPLFGGFGSLSNLVTERFREAGLGNQIENIVSGIKNLIPTDKDLTISKIVESLTDATSSAAGNKTDDYLYFDPKAPRSAAAATTGASVRQNFSEAIVFTVGGGNYYEYGNLLDWCDRQTAAGSRKRVRYGSTELLSPHSFIEELSRIP